MANKIRMQSVRSPNQLAKQSQKEFEMPINYMPHETKVTPISPEHYMGKQRPVEVSVQKEPNQDPFISK